MKTNLLIEIAARAKCDPVFETAQEYNGVMVDCHGYRFDLTAIEGDFETIYVPMPFSSEASARLKLYEALVKSYAQ